MVRGVDEQGAPFTEEAATVEINRDGARIGLRNPPRPDSELQITNLTSNSTTVLLANEQCPQSYDGLPEWRVKFATPLPEFRGITFDENQEEDQPRISAVLSCQACGRQELISFDTCARDVPSPVFARVVGSWPNGRLAARAKVRWDDRTPSQR